MSEFLQYAQEPGVKYFDNNVKVKQEKINFTHISVLWSNNSKGQSFM